MEKQTVWNWSDLNPVCVIRRLLAQLPAIVMAAVAAALLATSVSQLMWHPTYTARATVAVSMKNASYASIYSNLSTTSEIAETMTKLFGGDTFNTLTREQAGSVTGTLTAQVIPETNLLTLTVTDDDPIDAFRSVRFVLENYNLVSDHVFQNVILRELDSPTVPTAPSNPQNLRSLAKKAAIAGAALMTAAVLAVILLSDTVQTSAAVRHKIDARLYGTIHHEKKNKTLRTRLHHTNKGLLITMPTAGFYFTEEFGKLASKVSRAVQKDGKKVVMVTSVAENEGKSTITANLALAQARQGKRVLLIDADLHKAALYKLLGAKPTRVLAAILRGKAPCEPEETAQSGLYAIYSTTAQSGASELLSSRGMRSLLEEMRQAVDIILIDTAPMGVFSDAETMAELADYSLLVIRQDVLPAARINDAVDALNQCRARLLGVVFNDVRRVPQMFREGGYGYGYGYGYGRYGYGYGYGYGYASKKRSGKTEASDGREES